MLLQIIRHVITTRLKDPQFVQFVFVTVWIVAKMDVIQVLARPLAVLPILVYIWDLRTNRALFHSSWSFVYFWFVYGLMCLGLFCLYDLIVWYIFLSALFILIIFRVLSMLIGLRILCQMTIGNDKSFNYQLPSMN